MYMGYIATEENMPDDNPPIGIILSKEKDELLVEYACDMIKLQTILFSINFIQK